MSNQQSILFSLLFLTITSSSAIPINYTQLEALAQLAKISVAPSNDTARAWRLPRLGDQVPSEEHDTVTAKHGNITILFGKQHVLFETITRSPNPLPPQDLVAAPSMHDIERHSKFNDLVEEFDLTDDEKDGFDYSYEVEEDKAKRQELCPGTGSGRQQLLFDFVQKKCARVGTHAHCGSNMIFRFDPTIDNSTLYGYCECDFAKSKTPLVYHPETKACYFIYQKAYCEDKEWLVFNDEGIANCQKRTCPKSSGRKSKLLTELVEVPLNGTGPCVPLNQSSKFCSSPEESIHFFRDELVARCIIPRPDPAPRIISPVSQVRCRPGSYVNIVGRCQRAWQW